MPSFFDVLVGARDVDFGSLQVMDGNLQITQVKISNLVLIAANKDAYREEGAPSSDILPLELNNKVRSCLGVSFGARIRGYSERAYIDVIGAKAIFTTKGF